MQKFHERGATPLLEEYERFDAPPGTSPSRLRFDGRCVSVGAVGVSLAALLLLIAGRNVPPTARSAPALYTKQTEAVDWSALHDHLITFVGECGCASILVRLSWHDSGTWNASDRTGGSHAEQRFPIGEADDPANAGLGIARALLQPFKDANPGVSYADLWALAATVAIRASGGPLIPFRAGRIDGAENGAVPHGRLPDGALGARHLRTIFYRMGFDDEDIVALSGAHTLGRCHADRSGFSGPWTADPLTFDTTYFQELLSCGWEPTTVPATGQPQYACPSEPTLMMLNTDLALVSDPEFRGHVERFAASQAAFFAAFTKAFTRLQENGHAELKQVLRE